MTKRKGYRFCYTSKSKQFKDLLLSDQLEFICEIHNGLSAKIVEEDLTLFSVFLGAGLDSRLRA